MPQMTPRDKKGRKKRKNVKKGKAGKKKKTAGTPARGKRGTAAGSSITKYRDRARKVLRGLEKLYPDADCALVHENALQLLVATILSAQSTDARVNQVTPSLFEKYPGARAFAKVDTAELERAVQSTGFFRQKSQNIRKACQRIVEVYGGEVPDRMEDLVTLPGVARKTANVILGTWFGKNEGVVVDTHVGRLSHRLGMTWSSRNEKDAVKIEQDLMATMDRKAWTFFGHAMILHGRSVCTAKKPRCDECLLSKECPSAFTFDKEPGKNNPS